MKKFISIFVNNKILVNFITIFILAIGIMSLYSIKKELRPPVSIDKVTVFTAYKGASPFEIEKLVTLPIEDEISSVYGIDKIESLSYTGVSHITIDIDEDVLNKSEVVQNIFRAVDNVKNLPDDTEAPIVKEIKAQVIPIYGVALYGDVDLFSLRKWAKLLQDELKNINGINSADITGVRDPTIDIIVNPLALQKSSLSVSEIMSALSVWNKSAPAGYIMNKDKEIPVRIVENLDEIEKVSQIIVRTNDTGQGIRVRDVAVVKWGLKNNRTLNRYNGKQNVQITVNKKENADTIKTIATIKKTISAFEKKLPEELKILEYRDDSVKIKAKLASVNQNAVLGLILVVLILLLMLNWRIALVTAMGLPVAFLGSIWAMEVMGYTLNSMTIIGIILVVGMLVDDGIVVAENIFFHYEKGKNRVNAAIDGTREIIIPVIGTVVTTIVAFLPLVFMSGIIGKFMSIIPIGVITCLTFSLIECLIILPNHASEFMGHGKSKIAELLNSSLEYIYKPALDFVIKRRWYVTPFIFISIVFAIIYYVSSFKMTMFPVKGITSFDFNIEAPANTRLEETNKVAIDVETKVNHYMGKYITGYRTTVGSLLGRWGLSFSGTNTAGFKVYLIDEEELDFDPREIVSNMRKEIKSLIPENWKISFEVGRHGPPMGKAVEIQISHDDYKKMFEVTNLIKERLKRIEGTADVQDDIQRGFKEYVLKIDQEIASIIGVEPGALQRLTMSSFEGVAATKVRKLDDEYDVIVRYPMSYREDKENLLNLMVKTKYGTYVKLGKIAKLVEIDALGAIKHIDQIRTVVVMASLEGSKITAYEINKKVNRFIESEISTRYPDVKVTFGGEEKERRDMLKEILRLFLIALLAIYMILSLVFGSALYPLFIMLMIPFGIVGGLAALRIYGEVVSFPGLVSFVGLTGVVINDAIILVTYIRDRYRASNNMISSIKEGAIRRLRPIFITTFTTFFGLFPAMYELGGQDANMKPMAIVIGWGLLLATIMTMLFIPGFMRCLDDLLHLTKKEVQA